LQKIVDQYVHRPPVVSITFGTVQEILPLQGADIVATENYWHTAKRIKQNDNNALPRPHLKHFLDNMLYQALLLDREAIETELRRRGPDGRL
jgi:anthranilate/para-aminobenzoate synthase component II